MLKRREQALGLFWERATKSRARNLVVFSHYPTDYLKFAPGLLAELRSSFGHHVEYFGGHRHNVDQVSTESIAPNNNWLVGGGGGWGCEQATDDIPQQQGFAVVEISVDFALKTYPVL